MANEKPNYDQIAFDMASTHLAQQGEKSLGPDGKCQYRGGNGLACAVGGLLSDDACGNFDDPDGVGWEAIINAIEDKIGGRPTRKLLSRIQKVHDDHNPECWKRETGAVGRYFNLSTATIDALDWSACEATA